MKSYAAGYPTNTTLPGNVFNHSAYSNITIRGDYAKKPAKLTTMDDIIPYDELFDDAIQEYLIRMLVAGPISPEALPDMDKILFNAVDLVIAKRTKRTPPQLPPGIDYGAR